MISLLVTMLPPPVEAAGPLVSPSGAGTVVIGPQAMEGNLQIHPGDTLRAGFDFTMPGSHPAATASFYSGYVSLLVTCPDGSAPPLTIQLPSQTITDPAGSPSWYPSGDQSSSLVYQGALIAPDLCAGGVMNDASGALFTTTFFSTDTLDKVNFRFHYSDNTAGSWSATVTGTPTPFAKTVTSATLTPTLSLGLAGDRTSAIPGDTITYTATVTNSGSTLNVRGDFLASATGSGAATVASYWDVIYTSVDGSSWSPLVGTASTTTGYTPSVAPPSASGLSLSMASVPGTGVTYPASGDPILGTTIGSGSTAQWHYIATAVLSASQAASLFDATKVKKIRNSFHLEVTPANPTVTQPAIVNLDFSNLFFGGGASASLTTVNVTIQPPLGAAALQFNSSTSPALATLASGATTTVTGAFRVPAAAAKGTGQSDSAYFTALTALEGAVLKATASASATAATGTVNAVSPPAVTTIEHLPIVSIAKSGPANVTAGTTETNPLALNNSGGAAASGLSIVDSVPSGTNGTISGVPATLAVGASATASASFPVPGAQPSGSLTDTASLTWQDGNNNSYGPVSSSFTTTVTNPFAGATLTLAPTTAGPNVPGTNQALTATLLDSSKRPIANQTVSFTITGANPGSGTAITDANGNATFKYLGSNVGNDVAQATFTAPGITISSNTSTINWTKLLQTAAASIVQGNFYANANNSCTFDIRSGATPVFGQSFPDILFNPSTSVVPHNISNINNFTRPFTDLTVDVNGNYNGQIVAQGNGQQAGTGSLSNFYGVFSGTFIVNQPGDLTFRILHDDGYIIGVGGGATRVNGDLEGSPPLTTPFNNYPVVAAWNTGSSGSSSSGPATVHFPAAGIYPYELDYTECSGGALFLNLLTETFVAQTDPLAIYVGYADALRPGGSAFPFPWDGSPNTNFFGCPGCPYDAGALRFDNNSQSSMTFDSITVDVGANHFDLWPHAFALPAGQLLILTMTVNDNFDTSDYSGSPCNVNNGVIPLVNVTIGGKTTAYKDTGQILNTGGFDLACLRNESLPWRSIKGAGNAVNLPVPPAASLAISPFSVPNSLIGQTQTLTVSAMDGAGNAVANLPVTLQVFGPNARTLTATSSAGGLAVFTYTATAVGTDSIQASAFITGLRAISNLGSVVWSIPFGGGPNPSPNPDPNAPPPPTITSPSPADGSLVTKPVPVSATIAPPAGQTITGWRVLYQALDPGPVVTLASGTGTPPATLATFDPTVLPNDAFGITIEATASGGGIQDLTTTVIVFGGLKLGRFVTTFQDMSVPVNGLQMEVRRQYDSIDKSFGDFGVGWRVTIANFRVAPNRTLGAAGWTQYNKSCTLGLCFTAFKNSAPRFVAVTFPDMRTEAFDFTPQGGTNIFWGCTPAFTARGSIGTTSALVPLDDTGCSFTGDGNIYGAGGGLYDPKRFQLTTLDGHVYVLNRTTGLESVTDSAGTKLTVSAAGINSSSGPGIAFTRDTQSRITKIAGPGGATVTYTYDANGDLASSTDQAGGVTSYSYSTPHQLTGYSGPGAPLRVLQYDTAGRLVSVTDAAGAKTAISNDIGAQKQVITDPTGETFVLTLDDLGDVLTDTQIAGGTSFTTSHTYDTIGHVLTTTDATGATSTATYDSNGSVTSLTDPSGRRISTTYGSHGEPLTYIDPAGGVTSYTWDARLTLTSITNPDGTTESFTSNPSGLMTSRKDTRGGTTSYSYDATGNVTAITDPVGRTTSYTYDTMGRLLSQTNPATATTSYTYDGVGRLLTTTDPFGAKVTVNYNTLGLQASITDALGRRTAQTYDASGRIISRVDPLGGTTSFTYDLDGRQLTKTFPDGGTVTSSYDGHGRLATQTDQVGRVTTYAYDSDGRIAAITAPTGAVTSYTYDGSGRALTITVAGAKRTFAYGTNGQLATLTDGAGGVEQYAYDILGNQTRKTDALGRITAYTFNSAGDLLTTTDPLGNVTTQAYDAAGQLTSVTDGSGRSTTNTYDAAGNQIKVTDAAGHVSTSQYDALGRLVRATSGAGVVTTFAYDAASEPISTTDALGNQTTVTYDLNGKLSSTTDPLGHTTTYTNDSSGRMTSLVDAAGGKVAYSYDKAGELLSITDPLGHTTSYLYDAGGNIAKKTFPGGGTTTWQHDALGRTTAMTNARGQTTSFIYDVLGNLTSITAPDFSVAQKFDSTRQRTSFTDPTGTTNFIFDGDGRPTSIAAPAGTVSYGYDGAGRLTKRTMPGGLAATLGYDSAGYLATVKDWNGLTSTYTHDGDGRVVSVVRGGVTSTYTYDAAGRLTAITHTAGATQIDSFTYTLDQAGRRTSVTTPAGKELYTLGAIGPLTAVTYPDGSSASYAYDAGGNRVSQTAGGSTTSYTYDPAGRLTSAGTTAITYNADGQIVGVGADTYSYDSAGRMVGATVGGTPYTNTYDGDGVRVRSTSGANSTAYLVDRTGSLPQVMSDGTTSYVRGESGAILSNISAGATMLPVTDGLGSVRRLVDTTGTSFGAVGYDVFGATRSGAGSVGAFGFTGEQTDPTGLLFLRARHYNPAFGRFMSTDPSGVGASSSLGTNPYIYAADNPVNFIDPSGLMAEPALITTEVDAPPIPVIQGIPLWVKIVIGLLVAALAGGITACLYFHVSVCQAPAKAPGPTKDRPNPGATPTAQGTPDPGALQQQAASQAAVQQSKADQCKATNPTGPVNDPTSPCRAPGLKIFFPGADTWATTTHDLTAIAGYSLWGYLVKSPGPGDNYRNWYDQARFYPQNSSNPCFGRVKGVIACDEYPFFKTIEGGPLVSPLPSLATTSLAESSRQGGYISSFYRDPQCGLVDYDVIRGGYFVIPTLIAPKNFWICNK